jgi:hypothetical protein
MDCKLCDLCGYPSAHKQDDRCLNGVRRKLELADEMFMRATQLVHAMGDPVKIKNKALSRKVVGLDLSTWRYAM